MRTTKGFNPGRRQVWVVGQGYPQSTTAGATNIITFRDIPTMIGDMVVCVESLILEIGPVTYNVVAGKTTDLPSIAQLLSLVSIQLCDQSPPAKFAGGHWIVQNVDGYRTLMALQFLSDRAPLQPRGNEQPVMTAPASDQGQTALASWTEQNVDGWPQSQGPFSSAAAGGAFTVTGATYRFEFPIGRRVGEDPDDTAIPAYWLNGKALGANCQGGTAGQLTYQLGQTIDGQTVTYGASNLQASLYALIHLVPRSRIPCPGVPFVRTKDWTQSDFDLPVGILGLCGFFKALTAGGAQQSCSYTTVEVLDAKGNYLTYQTTSINTEGLSRQVGRKYYRIGSTFSALTHAGVARFTAAGVPLALHDGQLVSAIGSLDESNPLHVKVVTSGETTHQLLTAGWMPGGLPQVVSCAKEQSGQGVAAPETQNGNQLPPGDPFGVAELLPQRTMSTAKPEGNC